jgi:hypothetical protein
VNWLTWAAAFSLTVVDAGVIAQVVANKNSSKINAAFSAKNFLKMDLGASQTKFT